MNALLHQKLTPKQREDHIKPMMLELDLAKELFSSERPTQLLNPNDAFFLPHQSRSMGRTEVPPPIAPKSPRPSKYMDATLVGKLPQFPKCDPTPVHTRTLYPGRPLEDNGVLTGSSHLCAKHVPYLLQSYTVSDQNLAISMESPDTQGRHWFAKKEERLYTISHSINENLLVEKADAYPTSREGDDSYAAFYGTNYVPPGYGTENPAKACDKQWEACRQLILHDMTLPPSMISAAMPRDTIVMAMPRADLSQLVKAAKVIHGRVQPKRIFIYFGLDTLKKCGMRNTMHDEIEFDDMMKVVKRVLPAV